MKRSEVLRWLQDHGGQADYKVEYVDAPNPNYDPDTNPVKTIKVKQVTWTANDKQTLTVLDTGKTSDQSGPQGPDPGMPGGTNTGAEPVYEVVGSDTTPGKDQDTRTPEAKTNDEKLDAQRKKNEAETGHWETDEQRRQRENDANDRARRIQADEEANQLARDRLELERQAQARADRGEDRANRAEERAASAQESSNQINQGRLDLDRDRYNLDKDKANRPEIISKPDDETRAIAVFNPATGQVERQDNPLYDDAKVKAKQKQEELALAIQQNKIDAETAAQQYKQWFQQNVELPFMQAQEKRAQATEQRQALEAEQRRKEFAANYELGKAKLGQDAASTAINAEIGMMPYRVGPNFGEQMSSAINSLAKGGSMGANASAGIKFDASAFEYKKPDLEKIAKKATAAALSHLTSVPLDTSTPMPTADYSGINMTPNMGTMPQAPTPIDTHSLFEDWKNARYSGPTS